MSFALTESQIRARTKTVTRRLGWWNLKAGDLICAVRKGMGLKPGEKIVRLATLRVVSVRGEWFSDFNDQAECIKEGFPEMTAQEFRGMFRKHMKIEGDDARVNRIEFEYVDQSA